MVKGQLGEVRYWRSHDCTVMFVRGARIQAFPQRRMLVGFVGVRINAVLTCCMAESSRREVCEREGVQGSGRGSHFFGSAFSEAVHRKLYLASNAEYLTDAQPCQFAERSEAEEVWVEATRGAACRGLSRMTAPWPLNDEEQKERVR
jgi:hypothetical protein